MFHNSLIAICYEVISGLRIHSFIDGSTKDLVRDLVQSRHIVWHDKFSYLEDRGFTKVSCLTIV
jgi:hypothetical protein